MDKQMGPTLTTLLPSNSFLLAYALPLFFSSFVLTFAGAFLTLDRSRSFAPRYDAIPGSFNTTKKRKFHFILEGGIGGLLIGYSFGLHLTTFLSLLIPNTSSKFASLSEKSFLATWLLLSLLTTFLGGRYKYAALTLAGLTGGVVFSLALSVIIHPSLLTRIILTAIIAPILMVLTLLPLERFQHPSLRMAASSIGSFGLIVSIALLSHIPGWADVWSRYWLKASQDWGTSQERGLSAGFCLFSLAGMGCDYLLRRFIGECPDEKWDTYLANYTSNLPNRAGTFKPFESFWERWFSSKSNSNSSSSTGDKEILFPEDPLSNHNHTHPIRPGFPSSRATDSNSKWSPRFSFSSTSKNSWSGAFSATTTVVGDDEGNGNEIDKLKSKAYEKEMGRDGRDPLDDVVPSLTYGGYPSSPRSPRSPPAFLKKSRSEKNKTKRFNAITKGTKGVGGGKRELVKFGAEYSSSEDEGEDDRLDSGEHGRPKVPQIPSMASMTTLVGTPTPGLGKKTSMGFRPREKEEIEIDYEKEIERLRGYKRRSSYADPLSQNQSRGGSQSQGEVPEYSDYESDIGSGSGKDRDKLGDGTPTLKDKDWTPGFLQTQTTRRQSASGSGSGSGGSQASGSTLIGSTTNPVPVPTPGLAPGLGAVPATPSLIRALDRVAMAQKDVYANATREREQVQGLPRVEEEKKTKPQEEKKIGKKEEKEEKETEKKEPGHRWENFWRDVRDKAQTENQNQTQL